MLILKDYFLKNLEIGAILNELLNNNEILELKCTNISPFEFRKIIKKYPKLLPRELQEFYLSNNQGKKKKIENPNIFALTLIIPDNTIKQYKKLIKVKIYFDENNKRIFKIMRSN